MLFSISPGSADRRPMRHPLVEVVSVQLRKVGEHVLELCLVSPLLLRVQHLGGHLRALLGHLQHRQQQQMRACVYKQMHHMEMPETVKVALEYGCVSAPDAPCRTARGQLGVPRPQSTQDSLAATVASCRWRLSPTDARHSAARIASCCCLFWSSSLALTCRSKMGVCWYSASPSTPL